MVLPQIQPYIQKLDALIAKYPSVTQYGKKREKGISRFDPERAAPRS